MDMAAADVCSTEALGWLIIDWLRKKSVPLTAAGIGPDHITKRDERPSMRCLIVVRGRW